jgi:shikimate kinase
MENSIALMENSIVVIGVSIAVIGNSIAVSGNAILLNAIAEGKGAAFGSDVPCHTSNLSAECCAPTPIALYGTLTHELTSPIHNLKRDLNSKDAAQTAIACRD